MSRPKSIERRRSHNSRDLSATRSLNLATSFRNQHIASVAEESIARDLSDDDDEDENNHHRPSTSTTDPENGTASLSRSTTRESARLQPGPHSMAGSYRRAGYMTSGPRPLFGVPGAEGVAGQAEREWEEVIGEERSLLRDNALLPGKRRGGRFGRKVGLQGQDEGRGGGDGDVEAGEGTALLEEAREETDEDVERKWEVAVLEGKIHTTWRRESKVLARYSGPLIFTFMLQNSLTLTSIFTVGHIGKTELGAVSLGGMTANITGYAVYQGLATSLDTLCPQAYGSGKKKLVGLQLQRMILFLWVITIPIGILWYFGSDILSLIVPEQEIAEKAGQYLKVLIIGAPGYACFESSKRFVQAQGRFEATMYVLIACAPLNVLLHWLFVWKFQWGFIGCPLAVILTETVMSLLLFLYVRLIIGLDCWPGFTRKALRNWGPMIRLALPGLLMVLAEFLAFEILTLSASWISATHLAAQTVLQSLSVLTYQLPFPVSVAASTRVANLVGATLPDAAKVTGRVAMIIGFAMGVFNMAWMLLLRNEIPKLFTGDAEVIALTAEVLPINASFQLFDALGAVLSGLLRGLGKQEVGGYVALFAYYVIAMPISFGTGFGLHWDLYGLWAGPAIALFLVCVLEGWYIYKTSWSKASEEAAKRNSLG